MNAVRSCENAICRGGHGMKLSASHCGWPLPGASSGRLRAHLSRHGYVTHMPPFTPPPRGVLPSLYPVSAGGRPSRPRAATNFLPLTISWCHRVGTSRSWSVIASSVVHSGLRRGGGDLHICISAYQRMRKETQRFLAVQPPQPSPPYYHHQ